MIKIGSHVSMSGKEMLLGSVKEALSYGANTFMVYTGAPQNTKRKAIEELNIDAAHMCMRENGITDFVVHAPYIINLANCVNPETFKLGVEFLTEEINRTVKMGSRILILHPGSHVGEGADAGIKKIVEGLNEVLSSNTDCLIALETMAGKGSEVGRSFEELAKIYEGTIHNDRLRVCMDTCHLNDAGYDIVNHFDTMLEDFEHTLGLDQIALFHINDSKNPLGAGKDRHANIGEGCIGYNALHNIVHDTRFQNIPKILETPYKPSDYNPKKTIPPYKEEIRWLLEN